MRDGWHELTFGAVHVRRGVPDRLSARRKRLPSGAVLASLARQAEEATGRTLAVGGWKFRDGEWQADLLAD